MLHRKMPGSDKALSILGFGCMRLPVKDGRIDEPLATAMLRRAVDGGVNYVDTAWPYHGGESEPWLGRALGEGYRERVSLATKLPSWLIRSRADMDRFLGEQLGRLRTDHIDYYLLHAIGKEDWERLDSLGIRGFIQAAQADGRIGQIGFSSHDVLAGFQHVADAYPWRFCQIQYNYLDETYQAGTEGLLHAARKGLGIVVMEPLRGGMLARELPAVVEYWARAPQRRSAAEWALRWVWNNPDVTLLLSGMTAPEQVEENLRVAGEGRAGSLTADDLSLFAAVKAAYQGRMKVACTTCGYCLPCPVGIDIPECFAAYNGAFMFDDKSRAQGLYGFSTRQAAASDCTACLQCESECPQHLAIAEKLEEVAAYFGK